MSIGNSHSGILPVIVGVPQGSILGQLLFIIYVNDLSDKLSKSSLLLFANDAKCFMLFSATSDCDSLKSDLSSRAHYGSSPSMSRNAVSYFSLEVNIISHLLPTPSILLPSLQFVPKRTLV